MPPYKVGPAGSLRLGGGAPKAPSDMLESDSNQVLRYRRLDHFDHGSHSDLSAVMLRVLYSLLLVYLCMHAVRILSLQVVPITRRSSEGCDVSSAPSKVWRHLRPWD
jgi:hypothetical protein